MKAWREPVRFERITVVDVARLKAFEIFFDLPATELDALAGAMEEVQVAAGDRLTTHGEFGYTLFLIEDGEADVILDEGGSAVRSVGQGDTVGEIALLVTGRRTASVVARTPMRLLRLFEQDLRQICARMPDLERSLRRIGGERLNH